ncbi:MAG TPA: acyl carrier protein [Actinophytocola sp.]|uniref:acyl carrier protein n=1 Tax=Actinophytocola sp. TaxID=1872138 RepID=UPI002DDDA614|nr:acyl carrier protein [Actinophytocola sp.]HEV2780500.1 acyl carrier protein [Actinophytocola sp.]
MSANIIDLGDLRRILRACAGAEQGVDLDGDILDVTFDDLGYDSLAVMETASMITREYGVAIDEDALLEATTPRLLIDLVNAA